MGVLQQAREIVLECEHNKKNWGFIAQAWGALWGQWIENYQEAG